MKKVLPLFVILFHLILFKIQAFELVSSPNGFKESETSDECKCEGGIPYMTVRYQGSNGITINVYDGDKSKKLIKSFSNVQSNSLLKIDGSNFMHGVSKTKRVFEVLGTEKSEVYFHTSCSEDILGQTKGNFTVVAFTDKKGNTCGNDQEIIVVNPGTTPIPPSGTETGNNGNSGNGAGSGSETGSNLFNAIAVTSNITCFGNTDGSISLNISGGIGPFTYAWSNGAETKDISGLSAGYYSVIITDSNNNKINLSADVVEDCSLNADLKATQLKCFGDKDGAIDVTVTGGKAPYKFSWANGPTSEDLSGLSAGTYKVTVTDANGCSIQEEVSIAEPAALVASIGKDACNSGYLDAEVSGGTAPYTYKWSTGATSNSIDGLEAGSYSVLITDARGCTVSLSETVSGDILSLNISSEITDPTCINSNGGAIDLTVEGGTGPFSFLWSNGATTEDISGLSGGSYSVTVTDANGCFEMATIKIAQASNIQIYTNNVSRVSCFGEADGALEIMAVGGTSPYTYLWSNGATTKDISNLAPGNYEVTVTDAKGCKNSATFSIGQPTKLIAFVKNSECNDGSVDLTVSGGTGPYKYEWSNGANTKSVSGLEEGEYTVIVTDSRGCSVEVEVSIEDPVDPMVLTVVTTPPTCSGDLNGAADLTIAGGSGSYTYKWSTGATTEDISGVKAGAYSVTVTDDDGCSKTLSFYIQNTAPVQIALNGPAQVSCNNISDGSLDITVSGGTGPYTYTWSNNKTTEDISGLAPGIYSVEVTDAKGCKQSANLAITEPDQLLASITTNSCNEGILDLTVSGGSKPYQYLWSNGATTEDISGVSEGEYSVEITDAKGCKTTSSIKVNKPEPILLKFVTQRSGCKCEANGIIDLTVAGGTGPYTFKWSDGQTTEDLEGLSSGEFSVVVTDASGCTQNGTVIIEENQGISLQVENTTSESCAGNDGAIEVMATGGSGPYIYQWSNGSTSSSLSGLKSGSYSVKVKDATGCISEASYTIGKEAGSYSPVAASMESCEGQIICRGETTSIKVNYLGTGIWSFSYSDGKENKTITTSDNPYYLEVAPSSVTTYTLLSATSSCQSGKVTGSVTVGVNDCSAGTKSKSCVSNCFDTKIVDIKENGSCSTITLEVSADTDCRYALSHFSVAVPCGKISKVTNSQGWAVAIGTDPTTGISGFKIDDIKGFGENGKAGTFKVTYTVCKDNSCDASTPFCEPMVAYKAGQCVTYDIATPGSSATENPVISAYPNPVGEEDMTITLNNLNGKDVVISIRDLSGTEYYRTVLPLENGGKTFTLSMLKNLPKGIYFLMATSQDKVYTQRIVLH